MKDSLVLFNEWSNALSCNSERYVKLNYKKTTGNKHCLRCLRASKFVIQRKLILESEPTLIF